MHNSLYVLATREVNGQHDDSTLIAAGLIVCDTMSDKDQVCLVALRKHGYGNGVHEIIPNRMNPYRHTALFDISNRIVGKYYYALYDITHFFLLMWGLQLLLFGLRDITVWCRDEVRSANCSRTMGFITPTEQNRIIYIASITVQKSQ